jgi:hypothetical protein
MKKIWNQSDIINHYIENGIITYKATLDGDYKINNKEYKKLIELFRKHYDIKPTKYINSLKINHAASY